MILEADTHQYPKFPALVDSLFRNTEGYLAFDLHSDDWESLGNTLDFESLLVKNNIINRIENKFIFLGKTHRC